MQQWQWRSLHCFLAHPAKKGFLPGTDVQQLPISPRALTG
jgi:hypothetical protein